ncbi:hypothetical protein JTE90_021936 [Oedothorax gibbosus]|uniref:Uncharacterized protein n=1 Tax=Oedothorax gibbosus TaxID=931172 RepID=A0AAV6VVZ8_9ARAC|nr:hypothetical protein JTE90_021936 [Oedothorax gibbosus]
MFSPLHPAIITHSGDVIEICISRTAANQELLGAEISELHVIILANGHEELDLQFHVQRIRAYHVTGRVRHLKLTFYLPHHSICINQDDDASDKTTISLLGRDLSNIPPRNINEPKFCPSILLTKFSTRLGTGAYPFHWRLTRVLKHGF